MAARPPSSEKVVYAALFGNLAIAVTKFAAAWFTRSSAMLSEGVHSLVDTGNEALLLYGMRRAKRPPDATHPLGHGRELYFWSFVVALLIFSVGAGVSIYEGIVHMRHPERIENPVVNYVVLALSFVFEGMSWRVALKEFRAAKGDLGWFQAFRQSKDPSLFVVLFEDSAALVGLVIAFAGTLGASLLDMPVLDGAASVAIGAVLGVTALFLARESKGLLIGEGAHADVVRSIRLLVEQEPGVERVNGILTVHLAPHQIVASLSLEFADGMTVVELEAAVAGMEQRIHKAHPEVVTVFVKPQSPSLFRTTAERRFAMH